MMRFFLVLALLLLPQVALAQWNNNPYPIHPLPYQPIPTVDYGKAPIPVYKSPSYPPQVFGSPSYVSPHIRNGGTYVQGYQRGYGDGYDFNNDDE
jgi:hypothetical protein